GAVPGQVPRPAGRAGGVSRAHGPADPGADRRFGGTGGEVPVVGRRRGLRRRRAGLTALLAATLTATGGCVADPPSPVEKPVETAVDEAVRQHSTIVVSMDGIGAGFNPHLLADRSPMTAAVAE